MPFKIKFSWSEVMTSESWSRLNEDKCIATHYLPAQFTLNNAAQGIKTFAHIGLFAVR